MKSAIATATSVAAVEPATTVVSTTVVATVVSMTVVSTTVVATTVAATVGARVVSPTAGVVAGVEIDAVTVGVDESLDGSSEHALATGSNRANRTTRFLIALSSKPAANRIGDVYGSSRNRRTHVRGVAADEV